jgi:hypothetical protein
MVKEQDITELLFPLEEETQDEKRRLELYRRASSEAYSELGASRSDKLVSPNALVKRTIKIYKTYLRQEGLKYDSERGL